MRQLLLLLSICFAISFSQPSVFVYTIDSNVPYGFGILQNDTIINYDDTGYLKYELFSPMSTLVLNPEQLLVYGSVKYWGDTKPNGMLQYNIPEQSWTYFGKRSKSVLEPSSIYCAARLTDNEIVIVGDISAISDNPSREVHGAATCNVQTGQCFMMGNGIPGMDNCVGIAVDQQLNVFVYYQNVTTYYIVQWNGNEWSNPILEQTQYLYEMSQNSLQTYNNTLYALVEIDEGDYTNLMVYKNEWEELGNEGNLSIDCFTITENGTPYGIVGTDLYQYENNSWTIVTTESLFVGCPITSSGTTLFISLSQGRGVTEFDTITNENKIIPSLQTCENALFTTFGNSLWVTCTGDSSVIIQHYNGTNTSVIQLEDVYGSAPSIIGGLDIVSACVFGTNLAAWSFSLAAYGEYAVNNSFGLWNSTAWNGFVLDDYDNSRLSPVVCANLSSSVVVGYTVPTDMSSMYAAELVIIHSDFSSERWTAPQLFYLFGNTLGISVVGKKALLYGITKNTGLIQIFHTEYNTWESIEFPIKGEAYSNEINDVKGHGDIIYIAGLFSFVNNSVEYNNIAKYNLTSQQWLPIQGLMPGPVNSLCWGDVGTNASMYAVGKFQFSGFEGIAGCNEAGVWVDAVFGGLPSNLEAIQIVFLNDTFYMVASTLNFVKPTTTVYKYDGSILTQLSVDGVRLLRVVDLEAYVPSNDKTSKKHIVAIIVSSVVCGVVTIGATIGMIVWLKQRRRHRYRLIPMIGEDELRFIDNVTLIEKIGSGQFGDVYKAWMDKTNLVAVKVLKDTEKKNIEKEVGILCFLNHPNIVRLYGIHKSDETLMMVLEFMPDGNLLSLIQRMKSQVSLYDMLRMSQHILRGMRYLEEKFVVHRDLSLRNVLVCRDAQDKYVAKISDFGLSRVTDKDYYRTDDKTVPVKWTAIEAIEFGLYTSKSDVWSFGICLWELTTYGKVPYAGMRNGQVISDVSTGYRLPKPEACPDDLYELMLNCWDKDPAKRMSFRQISDVIDKMVEPYHQPNESIMKNYVMEETEPVEYN